MDTVIETRDLRKQCPMGAMLSGLLRAIGATRKGVRNLILGEAALLRGQPSETLQCRE